MSFPISPTEGQIYNGYKYEADRWIKNSSVSGLDDYETGTWTPRIEGSTVAGSYATVSRADGTYTKIGNIVHLTGCVAANGGTGSGDIRLRGLPFDIVGTMASYPFQCNGGATISTGYQAVWLWNGTVDEFVARSFNGGAMEQMPYPTTPDYFRFSMTYHTN